MQTIDYIWLSAAQSLATDLAKLITLFEKEDNHMAKDMVNKYNADMNLLFREVHELFGDTGYRIVVDTYMRARKGE